MSLSILLSSWLLPLPCCEWFWIRPAEKSEVEEGCDKFCSRSETGIRYIVRGNRGGKEAEKDMSLGESTARKFRLVVIAVAKVWTPFGD